jgi:NAD(P)-dependent dehydrogenase (short-subunit alcohol dehydrogenase family)
MREAVALIGCSSTISHALIKKIKPDYEIVTIGRESALIQIDANDISMSSVRKVSSINAEFFVFALGLLIPRRINEQADSEIYRSMNVNLLYIVRCCEEILDVNPDAKIFILGSESGRKGSFDTSYFLAKAALRQYVIEKKIIFPRQQILLISPSTILDTKMTSNRSDQIYLDGLVKSLPKERFLMAEEVARCIDWLIRSGSDYITNTEIEINGGKFARLNNGGKR